MELTDSFGRKINYLRLSVTDRCNMRCVYCMPAEGVSLLKHADILSYEELLLIAEAAVANGIEKIRITGGEPLVRKGILPFLEKLGAIPGLKQLVLTTNALHLRDMAADLRAAGVQRLNVSLDSLRPETFASVTRGADLHRVLEGIDAAERAGFPVKINMVAMAGINDGEILDFVALTTQRKVTVRFIEYMPAIREDGWESRVVSGDEILKQVAQRYSYTLQERDGMAGPARIFKVDGALGTFGIITPVSGHFCNECNRIRVTSSGKVRSCLFSDDSLDLRPLLAIGDRAAVEAALRAVVTCKPRNHSLKETESGYTPFAMAAIGG
ncbi:MAG TPA: GTP 3',8-cyclase MoaA [Geobacteraceae bacterium]|nr:GTP 3',8-cyclase MoaA [Geobacteraceae bacterium]